MSSAPCSSVASFTEKRSQEKPIAIALYVYGTHEVQSYTEQVAKLTCYSLNTVPYVSKNLIPTNRIKKYHIKHN
ncbi:unnamed protein product [Pseudo-nitzschia multistriata]|uniref:Uncharacterized protein n=1 Tax=Pseudo-nitzschia multistriata TaxID=183589 RepID=A0A448ZIQ0_9STRA|nr:unnamed protein product [Pseudo-nitzschia multistriata]